MSQYKVKFTSSMVAPVCGTGSSLTIVVVDGVPKLNGNNIAQIYIYYSGQETGEFELTCQDGSVDDHVDTVIARALPDDTNTWASEGGARWSRVDGDLVFRFTPPEASRNGASMTWDFKPSTPPVHLNIKIKRQSSANTGSCGGWPE